MVSHCFTLRELSCIYRLLAPGPNRNISPVQGHLMPAEVKPKWPSDERKLELRDVYPEPDKNTSPVQPVPAPAPVPTPLIAHVEPVWPTYERERELWDRRTSYERYLSTPGFIYGSFNVSVPRACIKMGREVRIYFPSCQTSCPYQFSWNALSLTTVLSEVSMVLLMSQIH